MSKKLHVTGNQQIVEAYQQICDHLSGYPAPDGIHVGGGRHVEIHPTIPGPGWTEHFDKPRAHPSVLDLFAHMLLSVPLQDVLDAAQLIFGFTQNQIDYIEERVLDSGILDETWDAY
jgi:hypothetical protein